jgi:hypothetical protein
MQIQADHLPTLVVISQGPPSSLGHEHPEHPPGTHEERRPRSLSHQFSAAVDKGILRLRHPHTRQDHRRTLGQPVAGSTPHCSTVQTANGMS